MKPAPSAEYELISRLNAIVQIGNKGQYGVTIGDDAAVRCASDGSKLILTTDLSVENIHFSLSTMTMEEVGYRAMVSNVSDCAAMGALPDGALVQLVIPNAEKGPERIESLYRGFAEVCRRWNFPITGGDLSRGSEWTIGITLVGRVESGERVLLRKGIVPGDRLWVSGFPGRSAAGLLLMGKNARDVISPEYRMLVDAHVRPSPRVELGRSLAADDSVHAMMDLSDGISKDCRTLCRENGCGVILRPPASHVPRQMIQLSAETGLPWTEWFFHGGEDYELLFAASADFSPSRHSAADSGADPVCIGEFIADEERIVADAFGTMAPLGKGSYDHVAGLLQ